MSAICDAHKKKVDVELLYNSVQEIQSVWRSDELEIRCGRENQHPERLSSPGERERNAVMANRVEVNNFAVLFGLQLPLTHNPFK